MSNSHRNDVAAGLLAGGIIGLTIGAFYRLLWMSIGIPKSAIAVYSDPTVRFHFMYYPAAALTIVALLLIFIVGAFVNPWMILYGLFIGWIAGDLKYYSTKWYAGDGWLSWCPRAGYKRNGQVVLSKNDKIYTAIFAVSTVLLAIWASSPAWR